MQKRKNILARKRRSEAQRQKMGKGKTGAEKTGTFA
jgi:hypothetical protein